MEEYKEIETIGKGAYGRVFKAVNIKTNEIIAIKKFAADTEQEDIDNELTAITCLKHPCIVSYKSKYEYKNRLYFVFELMDTDLKKYLDNVREKPRLMLVKSFLRQILKGVAYCHEQKFVHCDLTPSNILVNKTGVVKLADFGLSEPIGKHIDRLHICTIWYRPPEVCLETSDCQPSIDMWSIGCIFAELLLKFPLWAGATDDIEQLSLIYRTLGTPTSQSCPELSRLPKWSNHFPTFSSKKMCDLFPMLDESGLDLISSMFQYEPTKRITAAQALDHKFFDCFK